MKEKPILFNTEMVKAILDGRKTQSRRPMGYTLTGGVFKSYRNRNSNKVWGWSEGQWIEKMNIKCPFGQIGDRLYVRETWKFIGTNMNRLGRTHSQQDGIFRYKADNEQKQITRHWEDIEKYMTKGKNWKPSIHMPKWVSRIWLEITDIRVELVQDITEDQALKEGIKSTAELTKEKDDYYGLYASEHFQELWASLYKNWDSNPWVWVIEFKRITK